MCCILEISQEEVSRTVTIHTPKTLCEEIDLLIRLTVVTISLCI